jgi:hypothetical protein
VKTANTFVSPRRINASSRRPPKSDVGDVKKRNGVRGVDDLGVDVDKNGRMQTCSGAGRHEGSDRNQDEETDNEVWDASDGIKANGKHINTYAKVHSASERSDKSKHCFAETGGGDGGECGDDFDVTRTYDYESSDDDDDDEGIVID